MRARSTCAACARCVVGLALLAAGLGTGRARRAVDRRMGAHEPAAGDPAVLPDRLLGRAAGTWHRAARGAADPRRPRLWPVERARATRGARRADRAEHRGLRGAARRSCSSPSAPDYLAPRNLVAAMIPVSALIAVVVTARRAGRAGAVLAATDRAGVPGDIDRRRSQPAPAARRLARGGQGVAWHRQRASA